MNEEIKQLTELQDIDLRVSALDQQMTAGEAEVDKLKSTLEERQDSIRALKEKIEGTATRRRELESEITDEQGRIKERQSKMMQVQTNREYQSLLKEIEDAKKANKDREDEVVQILEQAEALEKILEEQVSIATDEEKNLSGETEKMTEMAADLDSQKVEISKEREKKAKGIQGAILKKYDLLRERRNGRAVVGASNGVCQGCFMSIPPQQYNEVLRGDKMLFCPTCQRILYHKPESNAE